MNDLKVFSNTEFGELGVMIIDGKEYFPAHQCAKILGYSNPRDAVKRHCRPEGVVKYDTPTVSGNQSVNYINEGNLYRLIVGSKLPAAERFERFVFDEVLPSIRKTGGYGVNIEQVIAQTATAVVGEVVKQIVPILAAASLGKAVQPVETPKRRARKYTYTQPTKMETLPPDVKEHADEMIISGQYSCREVANYIINTTGQYISQMAVNRYKRKFFDTNADDGQLCLM